MNMDDWTTPQARQLWVQFERDLAWRDRDLPAEERSENAKEARAHIHDALKQQTGDEVSRLRAALDRFGPLETAPPVWKKPLGVALHQTSILVIGVCGLLCLVLLHMAGMEVFNPAGVGLWVYPDGDWSLSYEAQPGAEEILGAWFIPAVLALVIAITGALYALWRVSVSARGPVAGWIQT